MARIGIYFIYKSLFVPYMKINERLENTSCVLRYLIKITTGTL